MNKGKATVVRLTIGAMLLASFGPLVSPTSAAVAMGQTATAGASVDGIQVPSGTTLLSPALVETGATMAVIHLSNGQVLALNEQTSALVESRSDGAIQVSVQSGRMAYADEAGTVATVASNNLVVLDQEGQVGEGARISTAPAAGSEEEEKLCRLQDSTPARFSICSDPDRDKKDEDCEWELLEVPMSEVPTYLNVDSYLACEDRNILNLDCDCDTDAAGAWWIAGAVVGSAALGWGIWEVIRDKDNEQVASPSSP